MPRPSDLPEWATAGITTPEPSQPKKEAGWVGGGEKPPLNFFNWWMNLVFLWIQFFDEDHVRAFRRSDAAIDELTTEIARLDSTDLTVVVM